MRRPFRRAVMVALLSYLMLSCTWAGGASSTQPNVLIIVADDCTHNDLSLYGGRNAKTPNIDRLAAEGLTFNRAYLCSAMCQPCRAELYTGQYPLRNGCAWNHSASRDNTRSMPHYFGKLGYRVGLAGKVHVKPSQAFPFEPVAGCDPNCVRNPTRTMEVEPLGRFFHRQDDQPFCLVVALVEPHVPWVMGDASQYPPDQIKLPPNIADTPRTRRDFSKYLAEITYMDGQVGQILRELERTGHSDDTLVIFTSEQGSQFPGCKWTNWDTGVHTALVARWPGKIKPGQRTDALVQYADVLPTLLHAAGAEPDETAFDGTSFLGVLLGEVHTHREFVYGMHNNIPEGPAYPIRTISDGQFRYIRNLSPQELYIEKHLMGRRGDGGLNNPYWATWVRDAWNTPSIYQLVKRYMHRPAEQLYHTAEDPYELTDISTDPDFGEIKAVLKRELEAWMKGQGDPGADQDTHKALAAARRGQHLYYPPEPLSAEQRKLLQVFRDESVAITPGKGKFPESYQMGRSDGNPREQPPRKIVFGYDFAVAKYEVPQNLWEVVMGSNPSRWKGPRNSVEMLSQTDAKAFCRAATRLMRSADLIATDELIRLPTEAEWEYFARAGTTTIYSFGDNPRAIDAYAWHTGNAAGNDPPVGAKAPNPWGLFDIHGYLWEWCEDVAHENYAQLPTDGSPAVGVDPENRRVLRGGSWKDTPDRLTSSYRRFAPQDMADDAIGLRCVLAKVASASRRPTQGENHSP